MNLVLLNSEELSKGGLMSLISIGVVFAILLIIIGITYLIFKIIGLWQMKKEIEEAHKALKQEPSESFKETNVEIKDDDMMAAVLVATIDYQKECGTDVRLVNVKEIK